MKKKSIFILLPVITAGIIAVSCKKETSSTETPTFTNETYKEGMIQLGKKINDPYSIENMRKAYTNIAPSNLKSELAPNKLYLRFLPKTEEEWDLLKSDTTLLPYDFPLDYEIDVQGMYYHDPSLPQDAITWQYTVVPVDYVIPNIQHEILYEAFIPPHEDGGTLKSSEIDFYNRLEEESFRLTGNLPTPSEENQLKGVTIGWKPKGRITVKDDLLGEIPLQGASVHARFTINIETCLTDADGYYSMPRFFFSVNYAIKWERADYDIRDGDLIQAWYNGPNQASDWNLYINSGKSLMFATIHRAADKSFYGDNLGIKRPTQSNKTKICYKDSYNSDYPAVFWGNWGTVGLLPDIKIWGRTSGNNFMQTNIIFGNTIHELGHQSHWQLIGAGNFAFTDKIIRESWALAIEWALTNDEYNKKGIKYNKDDAKKYNHDKGGHQHWHKTLTQPEYSPMFVDLMDSFNQRNGGTVWTSSTSSYDLNVNPLSWYPNDKISGYTLSAIQNKILLGSKSVSDVRSKIKANKLAGMTDTDVDELLRLY